MGSDAEKHPALRLFCHIPNGSSRCTPEVRNLITQGVKNGVPDRTAIAVQRVQAAGDRLNGAVEQRTDEAEEFCCDLRGLGGGDGI